MRTLDQFAKEQGWEYGEGFIEGQRRISKPADHIIGKPLLPSDALTVDGINASKIVRFPKKPIEGPRTARRFTQPMLLVREQMNLPHAIWSKSYLTYKSEIVGFAAPKAHLPQLSKIDAWFTKETVALQAFAAAISVRLFTRKATALSCADILALPYPETESLDLSENERLIVNDIVEYQRDLIRLGEDSDAMKLSGYGAVSEDSPASSPRKSMLFTRNLL